MVIRQFILSCFIINMNEYNVSVFVNVSMFRNHSGINKVHTTWMDLFLILILTLLWRRVYFKFLSFVMQLQTC
jgi:hypothetical protein